LKTIKLLIAATAAIALLGGCDSDPEATTTAPSSTAATTPAPSSAVPAADKAMRDTMVRYAERYLDDTKVSVTRFTNGTVAHATLRGKSGRYITVWNDGAIYYGATPTEQKSTVTAPKNGSPAVNYAKNEQDSVTRKADAKLFFEELMTENYGSEWRTR
jgi:hypothetical protein